MKNDPRTLEEIADALTSWLRNRDDVRSVALVIDWVGGGNHNPENAASIWLDEHGRVPTGDALATVGTLQQTLKLMAHLMQEANASTQVILTDMEEWAERGRKMMNQIHDRRKAIEEAQAEESQLQERLEELRVHIRQRTSELDALLQAPGGVTLRSAQFGDVRGTFVDREDLAPCIGFSDGFDKIEEAYAETDEAAGSDDAGESPEISGDQEG